MLRQFSIAYNKIISLIALRVILVDPNSLIFIFIFLKVWCYEVTLLVFFFIVYIHTVQIRSPSFALVLKFCANV